MANDRYAIFQLKNEELYKPLRHLPYKELRAQHLRADVRNYNQVYMSALRHKETAYSVFHRLMYKLPADFNGNPVQTSDVIVINVDNRVSAFYVDGHSLVLLPGFASNMSGESKIIELDTEDYVVDGKNGTWTAIEEVILNGIPFYIMKNEHDPNAMYILMSFDGIIVAENFKELTQSVKDQAQHHLDTWQKYYENGEYLRAQGDLAGSMVNYSRVDGNKGNQDRDYSEEIRQAQVGVGTSRNTREQNKRVGQSAIQQKEAGKYTAEQSVNGQYQEMTVEKPRMLHGRPSLVDNLRIMTSRVAAQDAIRNEQQELADDMDADKLDVKETQNKNDEFDPERSLLDIPERKK